MSTFPGKYLEGGKEAGGQLVDQRLLPRISEGEVRVLMAGDTCQMIIHKKPENGVTRRDPLHSVMNPTITLNGMFEEPSSCALTEPRCFPQYSGWHIPRRKWVVLCLYSCSGCLSPGGLL